MKKPLFRQHGRRLSSCCVVNKRRSRMDIQETDGGRREAGFEGKDAGACVVRAVTIATGLPFRKVYDDLNALAKAHEHRGKRKKSISNARTGVFRTTYERYLKSLGWEWTPTMRVGEGCRV